MEKIALRVPVIVEGKYDKIAVGSVVDAPVITTEGFGVFRDGDRRKLIKRISEAGAVVLCDSDAAGGVIRSFLNGVIDKDKIYPLYVPRVKGKERRKAAPSKEGVLGVEGVGADAIRDAFSALVRKNPHLLRRGDGASAREEQVTKADFYEDGLSGGERSSELRDELAKRFGFPPGMTAGALLSAINVIATRSEYRDAVDGIKGEKG